MMSSFRPPASTVIAAATDANETVGVNIATAANCTAVTIQMIVLCHN